MSLNDLINKIQNHHIKFTEELLLDRLYDKFRWTKHYPWGQPTIEIIDEYGINQQYFFDGKGYLESENAIKAYKDGFTLVLSMCGGITKDTWQIQQWINEYCGSERDVNLYFGNGKKSTSFDKHSHDYGVLVKNIFGESEWLIGGNHYILNNQNVLIIPKYVDHQVLKINKPKLSMTCNMGDEIG